MTNNEKRAAALAAELKKHALTADEKCHISSHGLVSITEALNVAEAEGYKQGAEKMREDAKSVLHTPELNQLDELYCCGGVDFYGAASCGCKGHTVRGYFLDRIDHIPIPITPPQTGFQPPEPSPASMGLGITPPQPAAQDDEREMREAEINNLFREMRNAIEDMSRLPLGTIPEIFADIEAAWK